MTPTVHQRSSYPWPRGAPSTALAAQATYAGVQGGFGGGPSHEGRLPRVPLTLPPPLTSRPHKLRIPLLSGYFFAELPPSLTWRELVPSVIYIFQPAIDQQVQKLSTLKNTIFFTCTMPSYRYIYVCLYALWKCHSFLMFFFEQWNSRNISRDISRNIQIRGTFPAPFFLRIACPTHDSRWCRPAVGGTQFGGSGLASRSSSTDGRGIAGALSWPSHVFVACHFIFICLLYFPSFCISLVFEVFNFFLFTTSIDQIIWIIIQAWFLSHQKDRYPFSTVRFSADLNTHLWGNTSKINPLSEQPFADFRPNSHLKQPHICSYKFANKQNLCVLLFICNITLAKIYVKGNMLLSIEGGLCGEGVQQTKNEYHWTKGNPPPLAETPPMRYTGGGVA